MEPSPLANDTVAGLHQPAAELPPDTLESLDNLASLLKGQGDLAGAEPLAARVALGYLAKWGVEHRKTKLAQGVLAAIRSGLGNS